eukprot:TRINITY_DN3513_c0_g2_i10.p1 TRINITY_DN3513_c0_g2~~TRINITY_DN3513_c0_g2_i10.p1  ORF type:complete len:585 (-),score=72.36 TRINITY_DN3513_c0_g2_i10:612-2366(-)
MLSIVSLLLVLFVELITTEVIDIEFSVQHAFVYPDGYKRRVITTNGQFAAPEIRVKQGDFVKATFFNDFHTDVFTIHWHGLFQQGTPWQDGVHMGTQCSILEDFTYEFTVQNKPGSYMYHAHQGALRIEGLTGPFIIEDPPSLKSQLGYEKDFTMLVLDWYHVDSEYLLLGLAQPLAGSQPAPPFFEWVGNPSTYLINGKGYWNSTGEEITESNFNQSLASFETYTVKQGSKYMFRIIGATSLSYQNVWIENHKMTVVRVDGELVEPFEVDSIDLNSGERYDVVVEMNQPNGVYWIQVETRFRALVKGWALLKYEDASVFQIPSVENPIGLENLQENPLPLNGREWDPNMLKGLEILEGDMAALYPSRTLFLGSDSKWMKNDREKLQAQWALSLNQPQNQSVPYENSVSPLLYMLYQERCDLIDPNVLMWPNVCNGEESLQAGEVIDIVIQSYPIAGSGKVDQHPWHLHGYSFYVLGHGVGEFSYEQNGEELNLVNPVQRDTVTVYPSKDGVMLMSEEPVGVPDLTASGWTLIRFRANNPGVWNMHCHLTWHFFYGNGTFHYQRHRQYSTSARNAHRVWTCTSF